MKLKKIFKSAMALFLALTLLPINVFASVEFDVNGSDKNDGYYSVISKQDWDIAPGISESEIVLNNDEGTRRQVLHVMEADMNSEYTKVIGSYAEMNTAKYQTATMDKQAAWVEENWGLNVVGAMNTCLSWYTGYPADQVGKPLGFLMLDEEVLWGECEGFPTVLVINKDADEEGNARPSDIPKVEMVQIKTEADLDGWEEQVIPCSSGFIVKDGENLNSANHSDAAPRSVVGIKADGTVVIMENDGRQAPFSTGMSMYELAEVMIGLGCTYAVNCDGGGSSTFLSQRPGEELLVNNSPSDGGLRPTTQGILFISTAPSDGTFVRASVEAEAQYYTPNSEVQFTAKGADFAGGAAEIPDDAIWQLSDESFGEIDENGLFVSNGTIGEVKAQLSYNNEVVGEFAINIVIPDSIQFSQSTLTVPNGKSATFDVSAKYGLIDVVIKSTDIELELGSEDMGALNGYELIATEDASVTGGTIKATLVHNTSVTATMDVVYGKASEVFYDFENGFSDDWYVEPVQKRKNWSKTEKTSHYNVIVENYAVTSETGMVHEGTGAAAVYSDNSYATLNWAGAGIYWANETVTYESVSSIGAWIYFPKDAVSTAVRFCLTGIKDGEEVGIDTYPINFGGSVYFEESGWHYCAVDVSGYDAIVLKQAPEFKDVNNNNRYEGFRIELTTQLNGGSSGEYDWTTTPGVKAVNTFYVDDVIIDYSEACEDKEAPVFGDVKYVEPVTSEDKILNNQRNVATVTYYDEIGFNVAVEENTAKVNATGLDEASAKAYIDGNAVKCSFNGNIMSVDSTKLTNGVHTVKFSICDNAGNYASVIRKLNVQAEDNENSIRVVAPEVDNNMLFTGSQYWVDVVADEVENVEEVTVTLDLNNNNTWILDHIETLNGFTTTYTTDIAKENVLYLTIKRTGNVDAIGEQSVVSIPLQTWTWKEEDYPGYLPSAGGDNDLNGNSMYDPYECWQEYVTWNCDVIINPLEGNAKFTDGTEEWFSGDKIQIDTEQKIGTWWGCSAANKVYFEGKSSWHLHVASEAQSKDATCTETGYENRIFCVGCACVTEEKLGHACDSSAGCEAVLDWGTTLPAKGHEWEVVDGKLVCVNGKELFNGVYTDGKTYIDGVVVADGWLEVDGVQTYYYKDGVKLTGVQLIDGVICTFDSDGTYLPESVYEGFYETENGKTMYFVNNKYITGLNRLGDKYYNFDENGYAWDGIVELCGYECKFDKGIFVEDENITLAGLCGNSVVYVMLKDGRMILEGEGATYDFSNVGLIPWYAWDIKSTVTSIYVGKDITTIGSRMFYNLDHVKTVEFEEGSELRTIKAYAMGLMVNLKELVLPEGIKNLYGYSFTKTYYLESLVLPESIAMIADTTFNEVKNLTVSVIKDSYAHTYAVNKGINYVIVEPEVPEVKQGIVLDDDGEIRYYIDGVAQYAGLVQDADGNYYYFGSSKVAKRDCYYGISKTNGLLPSGGYWFDVNGKILLESPTVKQGIVLDDDGEIRYYIDGVAQYAGLVQDADGNYYYFGSSKVAKRDCYYGISKTNGLLPSGGYWFDANGKILLESPTVKQGIVLDDDGEIRYYIDGVAQYAGLVQDADGNYYYFGSSKIAKRNCYYGISKTNGLLPAGGYTFDVDGKIVF